MTILEYYIEKQKDKAWYTDFQSISEKSHGKLFSFINTNFRTFLSFLDHLNKFRAMDGVKRSDWGTMNSGQETDKHRIARFRNAGFIKSEDDVYIITEKGKEVLRIYDNAELTEREKWILLLMLILDYSTEKRDFDLIKSVLSFAEALTTHGIKRADLIQKLSKACYINSKKELFETDIFWLMTFYSDSDFVSLFIQSNEEGKRELKNYLEKEADIKESKDCLAHKFISGGVYSVPSFNEDINISLCVLVIAGLQGEKWEYFLQLISKFYPSLNFSRILEFMSANRNLYDEVYIKILKFSNWERFNMSLETNIHDMSVALGITEGKIIADGNENNTNDVKTVDFISSYDQIIFYGVPGCGKSHSVDEKIKAIYPQKEDYDSHVIRVVFHPDYTNSDFVGQVMPYVEDGVDYRFKAGPFSRILKHAYMNHGEAFLLVIEEINRGNAAAIFGELFQLLDRASDGFSKYEINNTDITSFVMSKNDYYNDKPVPESVQVGGDKWILDTPIRLPPNLSILATMNTSDQNVFTLDNAFQRRWNMEYISNKVDTADAATFIGTVKNQYESVIGETGVKWGLFREVVNEVIANPENSFSNAEDKQLGLFFIQVDGDIEKSAGRIKAEEFSNKVLKYLWTDIFKRDKSPLFKIDGDDGIKTFGDLLEKFNGENAFEKCFNDDIVSKLKESQ